MNDVIGNAGNFTEQSVKAMEAAYDVICPVPVTTGVVTTTPVTTGPVTTTPVTTTPVRTTSLTTGPVTTGPVTTMPLTTGPVMKDGAINVFHFSDFHHQQIVEINDR